MRIAILADPLDNQRAGVHVYTREMVRALMEHNPGHELILVREKRDASLTGVEQVVVPNTRLPIGFASLRLFAMVPFLLRRANADVVVETAHFGPFNLPEKVKRVTIIHDLTAILYPHYHRWHSSFLQRLFLPGILKRAWRIIANSENTANDLCRLYPDICNRVAKIYPGVREDLLVPKKSPDEENQARYFLFVGTIEPRKGLLTLLEAYRLYREDTNNAIQLIIAGGKGWKCEAFFHQLEKHPFRQDIIIKGFMPDPELISLYKNALTLIYPSEYEGFGFPVLEAMQLGIPVIATRCSSLPELTGEAALLVEPRDSAGLMAAMTTLAHDPVLRQQLATKGQRQAQRFSWERFAREFYRLITEKE